MFDGKSNYRTSYINSRNLDLEKAVENISTAVKRNVALEIGPMMSLLS